MAPLKLDLTVKEERMQEDAAKIIKEVKPSWDPDKLHFKIFTDGLTNKLLGGYQDGRKDEMVLIRINGLKTELIVDRNFECDSMTLLHKDGLTSEVYAQFSNGLAYEFYPGVTLDTNTVRHPKIFPLICDAIAKMHSKPGLGPKTTVLFEKLNLFLKYMATSFAEPERQARLENEIGSVEEIHRRAAEIHEAVSGTKYPIVFCHNDVLLDNIIYNEAANAVRFIDFEYVGYNYQPFEVANHFNEYAGTTTFDDSLCPSKEYQLIWIKEYLKRYKHYTQPGTEDVSDEEVEQFQVACEKFCVASHFFASIWALVQAKSSLIDFDYLNYAIQRMDAYKKSKQNLSVPFVQ